MLVFRDIYTYKNFVSLLVNNNSFILPMKKDYYPSAIGSLISSSMGLISFLLIVFGPVSWMDMSILFYLLFFIIALLLGAYSLIIKKNQLAGIGLASAGIFLIIFIVMILMFRNLCVICWLILRWHVNFIKLSVDTTALYDIVRFPATPYRSTNFFVPFG